MPSVKRPGKALYVELSDELDAKLRARCEAVGTKLAAEVRHAIERHLTYPPAELAPLPDSRPKRRGIAK